MEAQTNVLLLNADYRPLRIISKYEAIILLLKKKIRMVEDSSSFICTIKDKYIVPAVAALVEYVKAPFTEIKLTRGNIFKRDGYKCAYCGLNDRKELTIDHVVPKSKGGQNTWENMVTCCKKCNGKKGDMTLKQSNMTLSISPKKPTKTQVHLDITNKQTKWDVYL